METWLETFAWESNYTSRAVATFWLTQIFVFIFLFLLSHLLRNQCSLVLP